MKKRYYLFLLLSLVCVFAFFVSCPQNIAKATVWKGEVDGLEDMWEDSFPSTELEDEGEIECYFNADNTIKAFITIEYGHNDHFTVTLEGNYTIDSNYAITAELEGECGGDDYEASIEGILNTTRGEGNGDFEIEAEHNDKVKGDWTLTKVKAY